MTLQTRAPENFHLGHSHLEGVKKLGRDAVVSDTPRHEVADDGGGFRGVQDEVGQLPHQEIKGLTNVSLADHLQQEGVMRCSATESSPPPSGTAH